MVPTAHEEGAELHAKQNGAAQNEVVSRNPPPLLYHLGMKHLHRDGEGHGKPIVIGHVVG